MEIIESVEVKPIAISINCCKPETVSKTLKRLRKCIPKDIKICCYPNNFAGQKDKIRRANEVLSELRDDIYPSTF